MAGAPQVSFDGFYTPDVSPDIIVAHSDKRTGNMDPRFDAGFDAYLLARKHLFEHVGLAAGQVAVIGIDTERGALDEFVDLGEQLAPEEDIVTDALITKRPGIGLMLNPADCMPMTLYAPDKRVLAMVHLGFKGANLGLHSKVLDHLAGEYDVDTEQTIAYLGPSIGPDSYIRDLKSLSQRHDPRWQLDLHYEGPGKRKVDVPGLVVREMEAKHGVTRVHGNDIDVFASPRHFSYTRYKQDQKRETNGRNGNVSVMRPLA